MNQLICQRVELLRQWMRDNGLHAFILPSTDPHAGEYIPEHWESRRWISGFDGSAGTAVVTLDHAALWTDSRYFLAAAEQLKGTPFELMREGNEQTPTIVDWLGRVLLSGAVVGVDGWVNRYEVVSSWREELAKRTIELKAVSDDPMKTIWTGRPEIPTSPVTIQPLTYAGHSCRQKFEVLRKQMATACAEALLITALDEVAWTLNLRGSDVHCNPVFVSYLYLTRTEAYLFVNPAKIDAEVARYLQQEGVTVRPYDAVAAFLEAISEEVVWVSPSTNDALFSALPCTCKAWVATSPVASLKAVKCTAEIEGFRRAMERDGVALVKFLRWLKPAVAAGTETELSIDRKLTALRAEQPLYRGISFDTIAGYQAHGAIVHYEATPDTDVPLRPEGLLLLDSGAQYQDGTTDVTRTIALGPVTEKQKLHYTLVLKGHICLSRCRFPEGVSGTQLDACARYAMWQEGLNFGHGTGHGVGSYLNVHEGPHQIRMNYMPAPLKAGMTVTDEPGLYIAGEYGVRIENTLLVVPVSETEFGRFVTFEPLTLCPIDTTPILWDRLSTDELNWLNDYHQTVRDRLLPLLTDEADRTWLIEATVVRDAAGNALDER